MQPNPFRVRLLLLGLLALIPCGAISADSMKADAPRRGIAAVGSESRVSAAKTQMRARIAYYLSEVRRPGIGITFGSTESGSLVVQDVYERMPAERGGVRSGDTLLALDGVSLFGIPAIRLLREISPLAHELLVSRNGEAIRIRIVPTKDLGLDMAQVLTSQVDACDTACCPKGQPGCWQTCNAAQCCGPVQSGYFCPTIGGCPNNCGEA